MAEFALSGPYQGNPIRRARKPGECEELYGWPNAVKCGRPINAGDLYVCGDVAPERAGGFGSARICLRCAQLVPTPAPAPMSAARPIPPSADWA